MINELKELIKHHTHNIIDENQNKWEVLELSDVEDIIKNHESKFNNVALGGVSKSVCEQCEKEPIDERYSPCCSLDCWHDLYTN